MAKEKDVHILEEDDNGRPVLKCGKKYEGGMRVTDNKGDSEGQATCGKCLA